MKINPEHVKLRTNILWDVLELVWNEVNMPLNKVEIKLPTSVTVTLKYKF